MHGGGLDPGWRGQSQLTVPPHCARCHLAMQAGFQQLKNEFPFIIVLTDLKSTGSPSEDKGGTQLQFPQKIGNELRTDP